MPAQEVAAAHARERAQLAERLRLEAARAWARVDPAHISETWARQIPGLLALMTGGQRLAASSADDYVSQVLDAQGIDPAAEGGLEAASLSGVASDGRALESLLAQPGIAAKVALASGQPLERAMTAGSALSQLIAHTQIADAGRVADGVALAARPNAGGYVRMVVGKTCSRCIILAGRWYRWNAGFNRHPKCDCIGIPAQENVAGDLLTSPRKVFDSMAAAEQDRVFTIAGAEAIRSGADIYQVVNARRGMQIAARFGRDVHLTTEGTTTRGFAGRKLGARQVEVKRAEDRYRRASRVRLMPEQIFADAENREDAIRLLRVHGYITRGTRAAQAVAPRVVARTFGERLAAATSEGKALRAVPAGLGRAASSARGDVTLTRAQRNALRDYESAYYMAINGQLRRNELAGAVAKTVGRIDAAMAGSVVRDDLFLWRGITTPERLFGGRLNGDLTGFTWREDAYTSTTAAERVSRDFTYQGAGDGAVQMRLLVPKGTQAVRISEEDLGGQAEILLARGLRFRIVADRGVSPKGVRLIDVEVLGA